MIRHILLFTVRNDVPADAAALMVRELGEFPGRFPQIAGFEIGSNVSNRDDAFEYGVTMTFPSPSDLAAYLESEEHETFVRERFRPLVARRAIVSFEVPDDHSTPGDSND